MNRATRRSEYAGHAPNRRRVLAAVLCLPLLVLSACQPVRYLAVQPVQPSAVRATTTAAGATVTMAESGAGTVITVTSATGIGALALTWPATSTPTTVTLHLHLHGLEELRLTAADTVVSATMRSRPPHPVFEVAAIGGQPEHALTPDSAYWVPITMVPAKGAAEIPLTDGYFAVQIPAQLLQDAQGDLAVQWIDFYR